LLKSELEFIWEKKPSQSETIKFTHAIINRKVLVLSERLKLSGFSHECNKCHDWRKIGKNRESRRVLPIGYILLRSRHV